MRRPGPVTHAVISLVMWPLIIIFSPVILLAGEPVNRYVMRGCAGVPLRPRRPPPAVAADQLARQGPIRLPLHGSLLLTVISNPLWIALTAPGRWVGDRIRRYPRGPTYR